MSRQYFEEPVIIVGGGIAGLALARALNDAAIPFRLIERRQHASDRGLALNLPGNAVQALSTLGLREQIESVGKPLRRREYRTASDRLLFKADETAFWGPALQPRSVRRSELLAMLSAGLPQDYLSHDMGVSAVEPHLGRPQVRLDDSTLMTGSLVVGADGVHSVVRRDVHGSDRGLGLAPIANASWRFMAPNPGVECWTVWASARGIVLLMPVGEAEVYGWAAVTSPDVKRDSPSALIEIACDFPARVRTALFYALSNPLELHHSPLEEVRLDRWHVGRTVLIGDAAHATAPVWAEGAALGMEDAIVLSRLLASTSGIPATLAEFETIRRPRVAHVQACTDAMSSAAALPLFVRNMLLPLVGARNYRKAYGPLKVPA